MEKQIRQARLAGVPFLWINTADMQATRRSIAGFINGDCPKISWDLANGARAMCESATPHVVSGTEGNPLGMLKACRELPDDCVVFILMANRFTDNPAFIAGVLALRDNFKLNGRMLVFLGPMCDMPQELVGDIIIIDEELPGPVEAAEIISQLAEGHEYPLTSKQLDKATEAMVGLKAFEIEQLFAMSIADRTKDEGPDQELLWQSKANSINQRKGMEMMLGGPDFSILGGLEGAKSLADLKMHGRQPRTCVLWWDEVEKTAVGQTMADTTVNADYLSVMLTWFEEHDVDGLMLVGPAGTGKSQFAKCFGGHYGVPVIRFDMNGMQSKWMGESGQRLRDNLSVVDSIGQDRVLVIATSNSISELDPALKSRFSNVLFFDEPDAEQRRPIWDIFKAKYGIEEQTPNDAGWIGRDIKQCCRLAWEADKPLSEIAKLIIPSAVKQRQTVEALRKEAAGMYLDANKPNTRFQPGISAETAVRQIKQG